MSASGRAVAIPGKGGTGKTTTTATLGALLAARGERVTLVDLDSTPTLTAWLARGHRREDANVGDVLAGSATVDEVVVQVRERLELVPSGPHLAELEGTVDPARVEALVGELRARSDVVLVDLRGGVASRMSAAVMRVSDLVLVPFEASPTGTASLLLTRDLLEDLEVELTGILPVRLGRTLVERQLLDILEGVGFPVWPGIRRDVAAAEAAGMHELLDTYAPRSRALEDYTVIVDRLADRLKVAA